MDEKEFEDLMSVNEYFIGVPDCVADGNSYKQDIEESCRITNGILILNEFSWSQTDEEYILELRINKKSQKLTLSKMGDFVDYESFISGMNTILRESGYDGEKRFCEISNVEIDYGVAFITLDKEIELIEKELLRGSSEAHEKMEEQKENQNQIDSPSNSSHKPWWKFWN